MASTILPRSVALLLAAIAPAQGTWVVDASGGPGSHFSRLDPAIAAARGGDRILVRAGRYPTNGIAVDKPLSILGEPGAVVEGGFVFALTIRGIPAGSILSVRGLELRSIPVGAALVVSNCQGTILLEDVTCSTRLRCDSADDVRLVDSVTSTAEVVDSTVVFDRCTIAGWPVDRAVGPLLATDARILVSRCRILGRNGVTHPGSPAITLQDSLAVVLDDRGGAIAAGSGPTPTPAIDGSGVLLLDPNAALTPNLGAPAVAAGIVTTVLRMPSLAATGSAIGGTVHVDLFAEPSAGYGLVVGSAGTPVVAPGLAGAVWLRDPILAAAGTVGPSERVGMSLRVPPAPALIGVAFCWQAVALDTAGRGLLSNPATYVHHP